MNNRVQQRFDRSIREAVAATKAANERKPRRDVRSLVVPKCSRKGRLYLCPETGATVWDPSG